MARTGDIELLRPAVERLRVVLRRMDAEDVPARLRPLTRSSARKVPKPILQGAVDALDDDDWLRSRVVEDEGDALDPDTLHRAQAASALFLLRPESWEERFAKLVEESEETTLAGRVATLEEARTRDARTLERYRAEIKDLKTQRDSIEVETKMRFDAGLAEERSRRESAERARAESEKELARSRERVRELERSLSTVELRLGETRQALEKERRKLSSPSEPTGVAGMPGSPEDVASILDRVMLSVRKENSSEERITADEEPARPASLPDTPEAVTELIGSRHVWLIDGYNVAHLLAGRPPESMDRLRLESKLGQLLTKAARGSTVTVYWDSSAGADSRSARPGMAVHFVPSADEAIIERARTGTVVVSTDRRVREESEERGAVTLWSEALIGWFGR